MIGEDSWKDPKAWWNKLSTLTEQEIDLLPNHLMWKYGGRLHRIQEVEAMANLERNTKDPNFKSIDVRRNLQTNEELEAHSKVVDMHLEGDTSFKYDAEGYMNRQPRVDFKGKNYNFE